MLRLIKKRAYVIYEWPQRMFAQLRNNGMLIIEPQALASYSKKAKKINQVTKDNFKNMKLMPNQFVDYLINEVGFTGGEVIAVPEHSALGFRRPIHVSWKICKKTFFFLDTTCLFPFFQYFLVKKNVVIITHS